ncbi:4-hydroxybenzoate octaprenyltransferase [Pseudoalteromonas sp. T1lg88]|uniref:4-hydroxybenzoate octaprenyltransferase n=1 Tax=Pseudoalteromonas sp. T1lg88 TaxID=2077104 RepID=UPI000CF72559|nr:4-hydroxybenzoate octaprenyltransferase [Pseudoalteromonas sp. T1lg88]
MKLAALQWAHWPYYKQLMRTDKPIGTLLLLWPTLWALWLAAGDATWPAIELIVIFSAGVFVMRSAGCVINDFADRKVDGAVARTQARPLAAGKVSAGEALSLFVLLILLAFVLVLLLNWQTLVLSFAALALAACYPFMKRYTHLPQVVLGAAFSWAIPMAYMATMETVPMQAWLLFIANLVWTVAYDTLYAMVDRDDDVKIGIKSTAVLFGRCDLAMVALLNTLFMAILVYIGSSAELTWPYWLGLLVAALLLMRQLYLSRQRDRDACFAAFLNNHYVGMAIFIGLVASLY